MVIKWNGFRGTARGSGWEASIEMMDLPNPFWQASFETPHGGDAEREHFQEGELEQAYRWCTKKLNEHEELLDKANS